MSVPFTSACPLCHTPFDGSHRTCDACRDEFESVSGLTAEQVLRFRRSASFSRWERVGNWFRRFWW